MLADLAGLSALPQPVPIRQLRVRAGTCPGKATGPGGSEDSAATPLLAHPRWGVKAQGGAHPRSHLRALRPLFSSPPPSSKPGTHGGPRVTHGTRDQTAVCPALCDRGAWLLSVLPSCWGAGASRGGCGHLSGLTPVLKGWHSSGSSDPDGKKMLWGLASLQTLSAHVDKPPSSAGGQKHQAVVTGSDVTLGEQSRWDWGHCMGGQPGRGRGRPLEGVPRPAPDGPGLGPGPGPGRSRAPAGEWSGHLLAAGMSAPATCHTFLLSSAFSHARSWHPGAGQAGTCPPVPGRRVMRLPSGLGARAPAGRDMAQRGAGEGARLQHQLSSCGRRGPRWARVPARPAWPAAAPGGRGHGQGRRGGRFLS